ncbi:MAG: cytochrome c maturation protein CcmE [Desulfovibrionaceae bacterium]|nr:cytochrome c maturation protein CcmE [Desulfovibrionaceae bacterium]
MARQKSLSVYAFALLLLTGAVGFMVWSGLSSNSVYFLNVSEALAMPPQELQAARLFGTVAEDGMARPGNGLGVRFRLQDAEKPGLVVWVEYTGVVPDTFKPGAEVIVEGGMGQDSFQAKNLMTKCPSKYQKENRGSLA